MKLTFGTGFICPECGTEATYKTGLGGALIAAIVVESIFDRLDNEGGTFKSGACGHKFRIVPGSRRTTKSMKRNA